MDEIEVAGLRIAYERAGDGPPLVLLHGVPGDSRAWRRQIDTLSGDFTVVAWDAPGCGRSSDPPQPYWLPDYADCLAALIQALALDRPHVLGLSFGGGLALQLAARHPELARTLIVAGGYAGWAGSLPAETVAERLEGVERQADWPPDEVAKAWMPGLVADGTPPVVVDELAAIVREFHPEGFRAMARAFAAADLRDLLPGIDVPTLLLYGELDKRAPLNVAHDLHERIPNSQLVVLPRVGHVSNIDAPEAFNETVLRFLREQ